MPQHFVARLARAFVFNYRSALAAALYFLVSALPVSGQTTQVLHWINDSNQNGFQTLNSTSNFITSFKGTNDVQVTMLTGNVNSIFQEGFGGLANNNNPAFLTNFIGLANNGTGDGIAGHISFLESSLSVTMTLRFSFAIPLTTNDRLLLTDVDNGERYNLQAFSGGQVVNLSGWVYTPYSGEESQLPNANWPTWSVTDNTNGSLISNFGGNLTEPLSVLTPDRSIDSVVITRVLQGSGSSAMQFVNLTAPIGAPVLQIQPGTNHVVLKWPGAFNNYSLYTATNLTPPVVWTAAGNPSLNQTTLVVTNATSARARFYRLQVQ